MKTTCLAVIWLYRFWISPWMGPACRFEPTCSEYACQAISHFGVIKGARLAMWRLLKCHPFHPGGFDPVTGESSGQRTGE
jgi:putative membrane protein insertion efficiency factor